MRIYTLSKELVFPHPNLANEDGILAIGGDLGTDRLLLAYKFGIFPWYSQEEPIIWWSPDPRFVLFPDEIRINRSLKKFLNKNKYEIRINTRFEELIRNCKSIREEEGTWLNEKMINAYKKLHKLGYAHSIETFYNDELVGGLYGIAIGKCFFGESMFSKCSNASKFALVELVKILKQLNYFLIDCQVYTEYLESMGARMISRENFLLYLDMNQNEDDFYFLKNHNIRSIYEEKK